MSTDLTPYGEEEVTEKPFDMRLMVRLLAYLKPYWPWILLAFGLILVNSAALQAVPYLTKIAVDDYIMKGDLAGLDRIALIVLGLLLVQMVTTYFQTAITQLTGQWAMVDVRHAIFAHLQRLPMRFFDRTPIGRLMTRNTNDVDALNELFTDGIVVVFSDVFTLLAILVYMFTMDVSLATVACSVVPIMFVVTFFYQGRSLRAFRRARSRLARLNAYLQENISGMSIVQLFNRERRNARRFDAVNDRYLEANLESTRYWSFYFPIMEMLSAGAIALTIYVGSGEVLREEIQWGVLVAMLQYVPRFFRPILEISERYIILQSAMASSERIFELLDEPVESGGGEHRPEKAKGRIEFQNVWFAYVEDDWVLKDVSFAVAPGEKVALVGATGSGKTTIISLLCRFYDVQKGRILVDGVDVREWDAETLRARIGVVQQDVFLFTGDIERNIRLGNAEIGTEAVARSAEAVNADRFIRELPEGYASPVNERGSTFSSGQRQLLSFARALAFDPDILVLDEATASVDTETEMMIQEAEERLMKGRTSIVIAHRISTIRNADRIIVMHRGEIREMGDHDELMAARGIYHRLHELQYMSDEPQS